MPKHEARIGLVSFKLSKDGRWRVRWWDARQKKYYRRVLPAASYAEALAQAKLFNRELSAEKGFLPSVKGNAGHGVNAAIDEMVRNADALPQTRKDYLLRANQFLAWLREFRPGATQWGQVDAKTLGDYLRHCEREGLAHDTVRMRFHVIRATSLYMSRTYPRLHSHVAGAVRLKRRKAQARGAEETLLSPFEVESLLAYAHTARPDLHAMMTLAAWAGLRMFESAHVREQDIDFERGTIAIAETSRHSPKTRHSHRTIPIAGEPLAALRSHVAGLTVRHADGYVFLTNRGEPWSPYGLMHAQRRVIKGAWRETGREALGVFVPRLLRKVFINLVLKERADSRILKAYVGHASGDVLGEHYEQIGIERMRREIVERIEAAMSVSQSTDSGERIASDLH